MKKIIALILIVFMCLAFVACDEDEELENPSDETNEISDKKLLTKYDDVTIIKYSKFGKCIKEVIDLTTENWQDYLKILTYTEEVVEKDAFGEIISKTQVERRVLGIETEDYYRLEDCVVEFKHNQTGEIRLFQFNYDDGEIENPEFDLKDYICTRIIGKLYIVYIPEEAIILSDPYFPNSFSIGDRGFRSPYQINLYTHYIYHNGTENWTEKYLGK